MLGGGCWVLGAQHSVPSTQHSFLERVVFLEEHARAAVAKIPDLRLDVALERNLAMARINGCVGDDLLQFLAEGLRREMCRVIGQRLLIIRERRLRHHGDDVFGLVRALPDVGRRADLRSAWLFPALGR